MFACRNLCLYAFLAALCAIAGCGQPVVEVSGKATLGAKPLTKATVFFAPHKGNPFKGICSGPLDESGAFSLMSGESKGAPVGWYKVFIDYEHEKGKKAPSPVNRKYLDAATSPISIEVVANPSPGAYDVKFEK